MAQSNNQYSGEVLANACSQHQAQPVNFLIGSIPPPRHTEVDDEASRNIYLSIEPVFRENVHKGLRRLSENSRQSRSNQSDLLSWVTHDIISSLTPVIKEAIRKEAGLDDMDRNPPQRVAIPRLKLAFFGEFPKTIYTDSRIADTSNNPIEIHLLDMSTGKVYLNQVQSIEVTFEVIDSGAVQSGHGRGWDTGFRHSIFKPRKGGDLLSGRSTTIAVNQGMGKISDLSFRDVTNRMPVRLLAQIKSGDDRMPIEWAVSEEFIVKHRRTKAHEKCIIPALRDEVWRLDNIAKGGKFHRRMKEHGIENVQDLIIKWLADDHHLQKNILQMKDEPYKKLINHAIKCDPGNSLFIMGDGHFDILLNAVGVITHVIIEGEIHIYDPHQQNQGGASALAKQAHDNWAGVRELTPGELARIFQPLLPNIAGASMDDNSRPLGIGHYANEGYYNLPSNSGTNALEDASDNVPAMTQPAISNGGYSFVID